MFCCNGFNNLLSCAGARGNSILACEISPGDIRFVLQSRGLAFGDEEKWKPIAIDVQINVSAEIGIQFCPFCGCDLRKLAQEDPNFFKQLVNAHSQFLPPQVG